MSLFILLVKNEGTDFGSFFVYIKNFISLYLLYHKTTILEALKFVFNDVLDVWRNLIHQKYKNA